MTENFGALLRKWRKLSDLTQSGLVEEIRAAIEDERYGVSDISKWEHGRVPPPEVIEALEGILSVPKGLLSEAAEKMTKTTKEEQQQRFIALVQQWREKLQFPSVAQLLREGYLEDMYSRLRTAITEPEEVRQAYLRVKRPRLEIVTEPCRAMLPVESEALCEELKELSPDAELWQAEQSWDTAHGIYMNAFIVWATGLDLSTESLIGLLMDENTNGVANSKVANAHQPIREVKRIAPVVVLLHCLLTLTIACDVFILAVEQLSHQAMRHRETKEIRRLRQDVVLTSMRELPKSYWLTGTNRVHAIAKSLWDTSQSVRDETTALANALDTLQTAQDNMCDKLKALELMFA